MRLATTIEPSIPTPGRVLIIGAGATGLAAAFRLKERGATDFHIYEAAPTVGGLARSVRDSQGFLWDLGGHVLDSHYAYFDRLLSTVATWDWLEHPRQTMVWIEDRFIPYPLQYHLRHLSEGLRARCLAGLAQAAETVGPLPPAHFGEWLTATFGQELTDLFLRPYNEKVWVYPPEQLDHNWVSHRVPRVDIERALTSVALGQDDHSWGPPTVRFPARGGTGAIWQAVARAVGEDHLSLETAVCRVNPDTREVHLSDGSRDCYDLLISTMPLDLLIELAGLAQLSHLSTRLIRHATYIVGVGIAGQPPPALEEACWLYYSQSDAPFHRVTVFSRYSPDNVPDAASTWSLMAEVSTQPGQPRRDAEVARATVEAMRTVALLQPDHEVVSTHVEYLEYGYPTPFRGRDDTLREIHAVLEPKAIYSRGRFGGWKFEASDQDYAVMQGVELVDHLLDGEPEVTYSGKVFNTMRRRREPDGPRGTTRTRFQTRGVE